MSSDWRSIYEEAIREKDSAKVTDACEKARRAINERLVEIVKRSEPHETETLEEGLRQLVIHEHRTKP